MSSSKARRSRRLPVSSGVLASLVVVADSVAILATAIISYIVIVGPYFETTDYYAVAIGFVWVTSLILMSFAGLYQFDAVLRPVAYLDKVVVAIAATFLFLLAAAFALKLSATFSRIWLLAFATSALAGTFGLRLCLSFALRRLARAGVFAREVVLAGTGVQLHQLLAYLAERKPPFVRLKGIFIDPLAGDKDALTGSYPLLGTLEELPHYVRRHYQDVDDVIVALPWADDKSLVPLVNRLRELAVNVYLASDVIGYRLSFRAAPDHFGTLPIFEIRGNPFPGWDSLIKTTEDYVLGTLLTLLSLPLMLLIAVAIKIDSKGPVLFRQRRVGYLNQEFEIYKFRTMVHQPEAPAQTVQATRNDPRVTRVGRILRKTSLDELPNLINVLNGTMSVVGPRPHAIDHNHVFSEAIGTYFIRHKVKPGITGWAQVNGYRGATDSAEKLNARVRYDIYYAENWSFGLDVQILLRTLVVCLTGRNAY